MTNPDMTPSGEYPISLALDPAARREAVQAEPIMYAATRERRQALDAWFAGAVALTAGVENGDNEFTPEIFTAEVNECIDAIESGIAAIKDFNTFNRVMYYDTSMSDREQYVRHRAMMDYLRKIGRYDDYMQGDVTRITGMVKHPQGIKAQIDQASFGVNIGYRDRSPRRGRNYYLRTEYRVSDDLDGHKLSLIAYRHDKPREAPILPAA